MPTQFHTKGEDVRHRRALAELSIAESAALVGVSPRTWRLWEAAGESPCSMSFAHWHLYLLVTNSWARFHLEPGHAPRERQCKVTDIRPQPTNS